MKIQLQTILHLLEHHVTIQADDSYNRTFAWYSAIKIHLGNNNYFQGSRNLCREPVQLSSYDIF